MAEKAYTNGYGVTWAYSKSGSLCIGLRFNGTEVWPVNVWAVWALYRGTHDLAPVSRNFPTEAEARAYANQLWATR
jgi:hypothetical protein